MPVRSISFLFALFFSFALIGCANGQENKTDLSATEFSEQIKATPGAVVLDVRTPEEFTRGHLPGAINYDWNGADFQTQVKSLDKSKPLFVYCLSGGRSAKAAQSLRAKGFKNVYELGGGIMKWRAANLPEEQNAAAEADEITRQQFDAMLVSDDLVLVDFYATWCEPCKKMEPYLKEIASEMKDDVKVVRLDVEANRQLSKELGIVELPVLHLYKNKKLIWSHKGYIGKAEVVKQLNKH